MLLFVREVYHAPAVQSAALIPASDVIAGSGGLSWEAVPLSGLAELSLIERVEHRTRLQDVSLRCVLRCAMPQSHDARVYRLVLVSGSELLLTSGRVRPWPVTLLGYSASQSPSGGSQLTLTATLTAERALWRVV